MKFCFTINYLILLNQEINHQEDHSLLIQKIDKAFHDTPLDEVMSTFRQTKNYSIHPCITLRWFQLIGLHHPKVNIVRLATTHKMKQSIPLIKDARQAMNPFMLFSSKHTQTANTKLEQVEQLHRDLKRLCVHEMAKEDITPTLKR